MKIFTNEELKENDRVYRRKKRKEELQNKFFKIQGRRINRYKHKVGIGGKQRESPNFEKAISQVYEVKECKRKDGYFYGRCHFPKILIGHKFKIEVIK